MTVTIARYELADRLTTEHEARVVDTATGEVVLVCHPYTATRWLDWQAGRLPRVGSEGADNDYRVCECRHLCLSHSSTRADWTVAPGVGNGCCGCGCPVFRPAIVGPAGKNLVDGVALPSVMP